ncbi:MAG: PorT family protein [Flavobacteriaceae bacterium]|nr:PorT family protein [Bacteroidia bacterium]NNK86782.1 PorT family protein [Flavobacteriaceae bacterium]
MKKLLTFVLALAVSSGAFAQLGVKTGVLNSTVGGEEVDSWDCLTSLTGGVFFELALVNSLGLRTEANYMRKGSEYNEVIEDSELDYSYSGKVTIDYLGFTPMLLYEVIPGLTVEAGPEVAFRLAATDEYESDFDSGEDDWKDFVKSTDFGVNLGLGYTFDFGLDLNARYSIGLTDWVDNQMLSDMGAEWKNRALMFTVGYIFDIGGGVADSED